MTDSRKAPDTDPSTPAGNAPAAADDPRAVLMSRLASVYEPRVVDWLQRIEQATRDRD